MDIYLVRHGESQSNAGLTQELDSHLTDRGQQQARATAVRLKDVGLKHAYVSPFVRTLETASPICELAGIRASLNPQICEFFSSHHEGFLTFRGLSPIEARQRFPYIDTESAFPCETEWWPRKYEDHDALYARAIRVRDSLFAQHTDLNTTILFVSHAETLGRLTEAFLRVPPAEYCPWFDNCAITQLRITSAEAPAQIILQNDTTHLAAVAAHAS
jgi:broad specificity phosphatase PhoE